MFKRRKCSYRQLVALCPAMDECKELFVQVVREFQAEKGRRPSAKELAKLTGLEQEDAQAVLSEIPKEPAKKKQKTAAPEPPRPEEAMAEPSAPVSGPELAETQVAETQVDEPTHSEDPPKEDVKPEAPKADPKQEDAKSEALTQDYSGAAVSHTPAPSPKHLANSQALDSLQRGDSQRHILH